MVNLFRSGRWRLLALAYIALRPLFFTYTLIYTLFWAFWFDTIHILIEIMKLEGSKLDITKMESPLLLRGFVARICLKSGRS